MNKETLTRLLRQFAAPVLLVALGMVLVIHPDAASALITKILGGCLILGGILIGISAIIHEQGRIGKGIVAVALAAVGGWLTSNPLVLAAWMGRILGALLLVDGLMDGFYAGRQGRGFLLHGIVALVGAVLILLPMTTSRIMFRLCGVVVIVIGALMLLDRLRGRNALNAPQEPDDDNIIDAL